MKTKLHRDGTVTYWSVYSQTWMMRVCHVPDEELAAMNFKEREKIIRHLG